MPCSGERIAQKKVKTFQYRQQRKPAERADRLAESSTENAGEQRRENPHADAGGQGYKSGLVQYPFG